MPGSAPDLSGISYTTALEKLHTHLKPKSYFEIGSLHGATLAMARCTSIAVDPNFQFNRADLWPAIINKPALHLFRQTSDDFFAAQNPKTVLGRKIDFAFLDGMHQCEFLLRDFLNTERFCKQNSIIALHDCLPVEISITTREISKTSTEAEHRKGWWAGDVWRTALLLKRRRPDLSLIMLDAPPTGLLLITNLDPESRVLQARYTEHVKTMMSMDLAEITIAGLHQELGLQSAADVLSEAEIGQHFWL